jgi:hypothetical protein
MSVPKFRRHGLTDSIPVPDHLILTLFFQKHTAKFYNENHTADRKYGKCGTCPLLDRGVVNSSTLRNRETRFGAEICMGYTKWNSQPSMLRRFRDWDER